MKRTLTDFFSMVRVALLQINRGHYCVWTFVEYKQPRELRKEKSVNISHLFRSHKCITMLPKNSNLLQILILNIIPSILTKYGNGRTSIGNTWDVGNIRPHYRLQLKRPKNPQNLMLWGDYFIQNRPNTIPSKSEKRVVFTSWRPINTQIIFRV